MSFIGSIHNSLSEEQHSTLTRTRVDAQWLGLRQPKSVRSPCWALQLRLVMGRAWQASLAPAQQASVFSKLVSSGKCSLATQHQTDRPSGHETAVTTMSVCPAQHSRRFSALDRSRPSAHREMEKPPCSNRVIYMVARIEKANSHSRQRTGPKCKPLIERNDNERSGWQCDLTRCGATENKQMCVFVIHRTICG